MGVYQLFTAGFGAKISPFLGKPLEGRPAVSEKGAVPSFRFCMIKQLLRKTPVAEAYHSLRFVLDQGLRYRRITKYLSIPGYLTVNEAKALYDAARNLPSRKPVVVEIGSHLGKSSFVLAKALQRTKRPAGRLYCIDPFDASGDTSAVADYEARRKAIQQPLLVQFKSNMKKGAVEQTVTPIVGLSHEVAMSFSEPSIDMLFIDGNHDYPAVKRDFLDWVPKLTVGGVLALHDVFATPFDDHYDGPWKVISEYVLNNSEWKWFRLVDTLALVEKR